MMDVSMELPEKIFFTWNSMFGNDYYGEGADALLGNKGTVLRDDAGHVRYVAQAGKAGKAEAESAKAPGAAPDIVGGSDETDLHMQNFIDCVRSRKEPNCPFELGFRSAIACQMANTSYRRGRPVQWDEKREDIV